MLTQTRSLSGSNLVARRDEDDFRSWAPQDLIAPLWVVHTKSRNEKALARDLSQRGVRFFLPTAQIARRCRGKRLTLRVPLFPSYMFLSGDEEDRYVALMTHRAASITRVSDQD